MQWTVTPVFYVGTQTIYTAQLPICPPVTSLPYFPLSSYVWLVFRSKILRFLCKMANCRPLLCGELRHLWIFVTEFCCITIMLRFRLSWIFGQLLHSHCLKIQHLPAFLTEHVKKGTFMGLRVFSYLDIFSFICPPDGSCSLWPKSLYPDENYITYSYYGV